MKNISSIGLALAILCAIPSSALATAGFLDQEKPDWIEAPPVFAPPFPTLKQEIRAADLLIHQMDTIEMNSPTYQQAHRLLLQHLLMMQRQLHFSPAALAQFQSTSHPSRFTLDPTIYTRDNANGTVVNSRYPRLPNTLVVTGNPVLSRTYVGFAPSRRATIAASEERNRLRTSARL